MSVSRPIVRHTLLRALAVAVVALPALLFLTAPRLVTAQPVHDRPQRELPSWLTQWSPLAEIGSIRRGLPTAGRAMPSLFLPTPEVGLLWTAGNPAGLAWSVQDRRAELLTGSGTESGGYKLPLEPGREEELRAAGRGWQRLGDSGAGIGTATVSRSQLAPSTEADLLQPYASPRLVPIDTTLADLRRTQARLEAAAGWQLGTWGLGLGLGYDTRTSETDQSPLVRRTRAVQPAVSAGIARRDLGALTLGLHSTWQGGEEVVTLTSVGAEGFAYPLEGYREVPGSVIGVSGLYRRIGRNATRHTLSVVRDGGRVRWTGYAAVAQRVDRYAGVLANDPPTEDWTARGPELGFALQTTVLDGRGTFTAEARYRAVDGEAALLGPRGNGLTTSEWRAEGGAELRLQPAEAEWAAVFRLDGFYEDRIVEDSAAALRSHLRGAAPTLTAELLQPLRGGLELLGGAAVSRFTSTGEIPNAASYGPLFQRVFAPELDILTSAMSLWAVHAALRWHRANGTVVWLSARTERLSPLTPSRDRAFAPTGSRSATALALGVVLR